jgi:mycofactocin precursor
VRFKEHAMSNPEATAVSNPHDTAASNPSDTAASNPSDSVAEPAAASDVLIDEDSLVEEVSIDGMCGVY